MEPVYIPSHYDNAVERTPAQFRDKRLIDAMQKTWFDMIQGTEDNFRDLQQLTQFKRATGASLNNYAFVVGLKRSAGESDFELRERVIGEFLARASDATPDSIRRTIEALTGLTNMGITEHANPAEWYSNNVNLLTGGVMVWGYGVDDGSGLGLLGAEGDLLKRACPVTTGSAVFGVHVNKTEDVNSLFVPCEVILAKATVGLEAGGAALDELTTQGKVDVIALSLNNVATYGDNWELGILPELDRIVLDPLTVESPEDENFVVDYQTTQDQSLLVGTAGLETNHGIMLEIATHYLED